MARVDPTVDRSRKAAAVAALRECPRNPVPRQLAGRAVLTTADRNINTLRSGASVPDPRSPKQIAAEQLRTATENR